MFPNLKCNKKWRSTPNHTKAWLKWCLQNDFDWFLGHCLPLWVKRAHSNTSMISGSPEALQSKSIFCSPVLSPTRWKRILSSISCMIKSIRSRKHSSGIVAHRRFKVQTVTLPQVLLNRRWIKQVQFTVIFILHHLPNFPVWLFSEAVDAGISTAFRVINPTMLILLK